MRQLPLPFGQAPAHEEADFIAAPSNALARRWLDERSGWINGRLILWGEPGCGKTHLLHIWARIHGAQPVKPEQLTAQPPTAPLAIDDADAVPDETALFHLLNAAAEAGQPVLLTMREPPARRAWQLPDLASRLKASQTVEIGSPEDELLAALLTQLAAARQLNLNIQVRNYLLTRLPRRPAALREAVARLDRAALDKGVNITRHLAMQIMAEMELDDGAE